MRCGRSKVDEQSRERCVGELSELVEQAHCVPEEAILTGSPLRLPILASFADGFARATNDESLFAETPFKIERSIVV